MTTLQGLEQRIVNIEERNRKVEEDKAWETSLERKLVVLALTYLVIGIFFVTLGFENPWINAIIPALGFFLSTLTFNGFKNLWIRRFGKK
jgi:hypothetical protein